MNNNSIYLSIKDNYQVNLEQIIGILEVNFGKNMVKSGVDEKSNFIKAEIGLLSKFKNRVHIFKRSTFYTLKAKLAFTVIKQAFIKAPKLMYFEPY